MLRDQTVLASLSEQVRRKIQRRHPRAGPSRADGLVTFACVGAGEAVLDHHNKSARRLQESEKLLNWAGQSGMQAREDNAAHYQRPGNLGWVSDD